jgi:hypothetical protein
MMGLSKTFPSFKTYQTGVTEKMKKNIILIAALALLFITEGAVAESSCQVKSQTSGESDSDCIFR